MSNQKQKLSKKETLIQIAKFVAFSMGAGIVQTVTFTLMNEIAQVAYGISYFVALALSVLYNFTVNRRYTFKSATNVPVAMLKVALFYCVFTPVSLILGSKAENSGVNEYIVLAVTMMCNMVTEYLFCRFVVYRNSMNTNNLAEKDKVKAETK